jgi:hypothetical protein
MAHETYADKKVTVETDWENSQMLIFTHSFLSYPSQKKLASVRLKNLFTRNIYSNLRKLYLLIEFKKIIRV